MGPDRASVAGAALSLLLLGGCAVHAPSDGPPVRGGQPPAEPPPDALPRAEPRSRYGNGPVYEVHGRRYEVLDTSYGYQERGVASWYGKKFHGRPTSSREPYDMHSMTAAHKTLPLPTYVRVRNLRNNRSVVVRVNDRGPFVENRIIDLSYAAARRLDMVRDGTSLVEITAISFDEPPPGADTLTATTEPASLPADVNDVYVQVGAFGDADNARRRHALLTSNGIHEAFIHEDRHAAESLYRVRIGPIAGVDQYDLLVARLQRLGISETHLVTE